MAEKDADLKENIKKSFFKVKEDIETIERETKGNTCDISKINKKMNEIYEKIDKIDQFIEKTGKIDDIFFKSSIGNKGVVNDQQQSTMINNDQQCQTMPNNDQRSTTVSKQFALLDQTFVKKVRELTDREFSVFIKVYELNATNEEVHFTDLANHLKITEGTVRGSVSRIISKGLPLVKERFFNKKSSLFIDPALFNPQLLPEIINIRGISTQKTLDDKTFLKPPTY